ncbi:TonB-dependent receptor [Kordiimonas lacus]|uniref:Iron complex outermembrane recepter protein n=1 Tax=Kordiimonas lacus TaxID=637679 RepID=A0A1G6SZ84_9PROT|nr:TonB-dependent receptor [Kordiimonas lacus]SDD22290.1 iron complex outermembrane recepter protein [Kordiimonas lacus]
MPRIRRTYLPMLLGSALVPALSVPATGVEAEGPVEEIIVHARKREQTLTDTPVSISVVGATTIEDWTLTSLEDLELAVPNLRTAAQFAYNNTVSLRGVGTYSRNIGFDERVGLYLDGIYLGPSYGLNQSLLDVAQVEVMRGPQGTFFGRNAIAGAVTLISAKPGPEVSGRALARYGRFDTRTFEGSLNIPLSDTLFASLSGSLHKRDGLTTNLFDGSKIDNRNRNSLRAQMLYRPSDRFEAHLSLDRNEIDEAMLVGDPNSDTFGIFPDTVAPAPFEVDFNVAPTQKVITKGAGLSMTWTFEGGMELKSLTGLRSTDAAHHYDTDYTSIDILYVDYAEDYGHFSQELRLTSPDDGNRLGYVLGVTYLDQKGETDRHAIGGAAAFILGAAEGADMTSIGRVDTEAWGLYASFDYRLSDALTLSAGLRWSRDEKSVDWSVDTTGAPAFQLATGTLKDSRHDTDVSPTFSLSYAPTDAITAFLRYGEGFKSGGYNLDYVSAAIFPDQLEFEKESARSYEAGIKGSLWDGMAWFSATAFWVDYRNFQVNQFLDQGGGSTIIVISNAAKVRTKGLELELTARPTDGLSLTTSLALLDAKYRQFVDGGVGATDVSGNKLEAPDVEASIALAYERPISDSLMGFINLNASFADSYFVTPDNITEQPLLGGGSVPFGQISSRSQLNAKLGVGSPADGWTAAFWLQNGFGDGGTAASLRDFFGTIVEAQTVPRSYGVELTYEF